jgi:hypothetical protein
MVRVAVASVLLSLVGCFPPGGLGYSAQPYNVMNPGVNWSGDYPPFPAPQGPPTPYPTLDPSSW